MRIFTILKGSERQILAYKIKKNLAGTRSFYERQIKTIVAKPLVPVKRPQERVKQ